jgi:formylglycine-generating enzyme required for sulfatase activity
MKLNLDRYRATRITRFKPALTIFLLVVNTGCGLFSASTPKRGDVEENPTDGLHYVWIPSGGFQAGCSKFDEECSPEEKPAHEVSLSNGFWIGQTEVTVGAYHKFTAATHRQMPPEAHFGAKVLNARWADPRMPIVNVDWNEARAYCDWIGGRLPTEAQWEYAARGDSTNARYASLANIAWFGDNSGAHHLDTAKLIKENESGYLWQLSSNGNAFREVALMAPNTYGLYDMLGNVWEWTSDWYGETYYHDSARFDPTGPPTGELRVLRGGSWTNVANAVRVSVRGRRPPATTSIDTGFRCIHY